MPKNLKSTLRKIYAYRALDDFILIYPFYTIFMAAKGLSVFQISTLLVIWSVSDLIFNVPTGVLADKYSRRLLLGLAQLIKASGFITWFLFPHYVGFAIGFVLWGIGGTFDGGTFEAIVFDELKTVGQEAKYVKVMGAARSWGLTGDLVATALAGAAIILGYGFVFGASIVVPIISAFLAFSLPATTRFDHVADPRYFSMLKQGIIEAVQTRTILAIIMLGGFVGAIYGSIEEYVPLIVHQTHLSLSVVPLVVAITVASAAIASYTAYRFEKLSTTTFMIVLAIAGVMLLGAGLAANMGAIALLIGYTYLVNMLAVVFDGKLQHSITGGLRATITSVNGFTLELLSIVIYFAYGIIARHGDNFAAIKILGAVVALVVALAYLLLGRHILSKQALQAVGEHARD